MLQGRGQESATSDGGKRGATFGGWQYLKLLEQVTRPQAETQVTLLGAALTEVSLFALLFASKGERRATDKGLSFPQTNANK